MQPIDPSSVPAVSPSSESSDHELLLGVLAHELRTPITTIYAGSAVLAREDDLLPSMRRELAADVYAEAARLFRAVEDLLVMTRLEHGALSMTPEPVSVIRAVDAAAQYESARWPGLRVLLQREGTPPPATADANALAHALRNLIANVGWRATGPTELDVVVEPDGDRVACRLLERTGTLHRDDLVSLFDLPAADPRPGMTSPGIAMYVASQLIQAMRGRAWANEREDGVTEIGFDLPRSEPA
jgi:two-component system sensor histidine kinase KdpD